MSDQRRWTNNDALRRLYAVSCRAETLPGFGTASATLTALAQYARTASLAIEAAKAVALAVSAPRPHPDYGDDGHRDHCRESALDALERAERALGIKPPTETP